MIKKDITASGRQFDVAEKMSDYPDIDLFFMIMRLRLLYVSGQGYTRMKLRTLLKHYGYKLYTVQGKPENIKITTPSDFYIFRAMVDARESSQIFGI